MEKELFLKISKWQEETFKESTALSKLAHLKEEISEVVLDIKNDLPSKRMEFADCFILLYGAAAADGMSYEDIQQAIQEKHLINTNRKWGKPDANGIVNHIK